MQSQMQFFSSLKKGDHVEITRPGRTSFYPAIVLRTPAKIKHLVFVEYPALFFAAEEGPMEPPKRLREYVNAANVRPKLPLELNLCFKVGDLVDGYRENEWLPGRVKEILENSRYLVTFEGREGNNVEIEQCNLRLHRRWVDGSWVPPLHAQEKLPEMENQSLNMRFKIKYSRKSREPIFKKGEVVEVCSDEEGYKGAWFVATIFDSMGNESFLVEYRDLTTDDGSKLLKEAADASHIRPLPPQIPSVGSFKQLQEVDAWYNDGWWEGKILEVLNRGEYLVLFMPNKETLKFEHSKLRLHQDWINRKWVMGSKWWCQNSSQLSKTCGDVKLKSKCSGNKLVFKFPKSTKMADQRRKVKSKTEDSVIPLNVKFSKGAKVEVRSDEEGYQGAWYTATVVGLMQNGKYLVEYLTLKTDDLMEQLKEEADASDIRPYPPDIMHHRFALSEWVDTWYNDGWWVGQISCVLPGSKYRVYFWPTGEDLEFDHWQLRPHQEWTNGKWTVTS